MTKSKAESPMGFRPPKYLRVLIEEWLKLNPGIDKSTMISLAIEKFITEDNVLMGVKDKEVNVTFAEKQEVREALTRLMREHAQTLEKLK